MSSATSDQLLHEAYELIEAEKHDEAQAILKPFLEENPDNADAWWLYAHAVTDAETGRMALNQVLRIDDSYQEAQTLLTQLDENSGSDFGAIETPPGLPEDSDMVQAGALDQDDLAGFSLEDTGPIFGDRVVEAEAQESGRGGLRFILMALLLIVVVVVAAILVVNPFAPADTTEATSQPTPQATSVAQQDTPTSEAVMLEALPALETVSDEANSSVTAVLSDFDLVEQGIGTSETSMGNTLLASICTTGGTFRDDLSGSMDALAAVSDGVADDVGALGVAFIDCESDRLLRIIAVSIEDAIAFNNGDIDASVYQSSWSAAA